MTPSPTKYAAPQGVYRGGKACTWTTREDGIHHFQITESTRASVDEWTAHLDVIFAGLAPHERVRYILDYRIAVPPLAYGAQRSRAWLASHPDMNHAFVAFVYRDGSLMVLLNNIIRLLRASRVTTRFFNRFDEALAWLQSIPPREAGA